MLSQDIVTVSSSVSLRVLSYVFLRWIPGHPFPPLIASLLAVYAISFSLSVASTSKFNVIGRTNSAPKIGTANDAIGQRVLKCLHEKDEVIEYQDVVEMITVKCKPSSVRKTILTGLPSPSSSLANIITFTINLICFSMVMDFTYRGKLFYSSREMSLARVGFVSDNGAKIFVREPNILNLPIHLSYRYADATFPKRRDENPIDTAWKSAGTIFSLNEESDFTAAMQITQLNSDTRYQYTFSNNHSGFFVTAPRVGELSKINAGKLGFLHTSCIKANFPYSPMSHPLSIPGFSYLAKWLSKLKPQFLLFLGDFIYVDVPRRFGSHKSNYRDEYRRVYNSPDWPAVSKTDIYDIPWLHVYDDHEIANDWDQNTTGVFSAAFEPYNLYHVSVNPPRYRPSNANATYFTFTQGPAAFFLLDTRRFRDSSTMKSPDDPTKSMLGKDQLSDLLEWLRKPEPECVRWKFVISSVPFTKNWRINALDTWSGYLAERKVILEAMWDLSLASSSIGVVILSGDRHEFAATAFPPPLATPGNPDARSWPRNATVHEFSASPLNMFYLPTRTYRQTDQEDVCLKYVPDGNSKFGAIEIEAATGSEQSILRYRLFVDGQEVWSHVLMTPPSNIGKDGGAGENGGKD